jgi:hypothetical protein
MAKSGTDKVEERRGFLLVLGVDFVRAIRAMEGIERIALIGSLCTDKPKPRDIDFLLSVRPGMDLAPMARRARSLKGATQSLSSGADVFLAEEGRYIGRICGYRECFPRVLCLALHCGLRPHLNDDLRNLNLKKLPDRRPASGPLAPMEGQARGA